VSFWSEIIVLAVPGILKVSLASLLLAGVAGCQQTPQPQGLSEQEKADIRDSWNSSSAQVVHPNSTMLIEGPAPLVYQIGQAGTILVTDSNSGMPLARTTVGRGTIIRIEPEQGVYAGLRQLCPGPLTPGRRYGIVLREEETNNWTSGIQAPHPAPPVMPRPTNPKNTPLF
jgi:hypothetical protein